MAQLKPETQKMIEEYGLKKDDVWDCHGTWVIYHKALERIAADRDVRFDEPEIICSDMEKKMIAIRVTGWLDKKREWSIGEAAPYNNKNSYPFAMAEKRAKDRVILKLLGLHGEFYSDQEADEFVQSRPNHGEMNGPLTITKLKEECRALAGALDSATDMDLFLAVKDRFAPVIEQMQRDLPVWWKGKEGSDNEGLEKRLQRQEEDLRKMERMAAE